MKKLVLAFVVIFACQSVQSVFGWGQKGHDIIAYIAQNHVSKKTEKAVVKALGGHTFMYYSSWMDNIRNHPGYEMTKTWHYANVDEGHTYETQPKEPNGDVYTAITMVIEALKDHKNLPDSLETVYLKYLIHMMGDLHCPMHAGRLSDRGGNQFRVQWFGNPTNIHSVWDSSFIESARKWSYTEWSDNIDYVSKAGREAMTRGTVMDWFTETVNACKEIYLSIEEGQNLSWDYMFDNFPLLESQLQKGGYRLARVLDEIYK